MKTITEQPLTAPVQTAIEKVLSTRRRVPIRLFTLSEAEEKYLVETQDRPAWDVYSQCLDLHAYLAALADRRSVSLRTLREQYFRSEMEATGRSWQRVCNKYGLGNVPPPAGGGELDLEAERLRDEANQARHRAEAAAREVEHRMDRARAASEAVHNAEQQLTEARNLASQVRGAVPGLEYQAAFSWNIGTANPGSIYQSLELHLAMLADFPRVEKLLLAALETAQAAQSAIEKI